jgi:hypothetical protein
MVRREADVQAQQRLAAGPAEPAAQHLSAVAERWLGQALTAAAPQVAPPEEEDGLERPQRVAALAVPAARRQKAAAEAQEPQRPEESRAPPVGWRRAAERRVAADAARALRLEERATPEVPGVPRQTVAAAQADAPRRAAPE